MSVAIWYLLSIKNIRISGGIMLKSKYQHTLSKAVKIEGVGVHSGEKATIVINPAADNSGIVYLRTDINDRNNIIPAKWSNVSDTKLCTAITNEDGVRVSTVEHLMSAFATLGVDNAIVEIDGPEIPIMDGSSKEFVKAMLKAGLKKQKARRKAILIKQVVHCEENGVEVRLIPSDERKFSMEIEFASKAIGLQTYEFTLSDEMEYKKEISAARTFGMLHEVEYLRKMGLARGGSLDNAIVVDGDNVLNPEGLRYENEFVRHKILDAIGDMYMAGMPIIANYQGFKSSHAMNNHLLRELFAHPEAYEIVDFIPVSNEVSEAHDDNGVYVNALAVA